MLLSDFQYDLPKRLIAQSPTERRTGSRLMVVDRKRQSIFHRSFEDLIEYLNPGDCLVFNNTRVIPARLLGKKVPCGGCTQAAAKGARIEALLIREIDAGTSADSHENEKSKIQTEGAAADDYLLAASDTLSCSDIGGAEWEAITRPAKRLPKGTLISFGDGELRAIVTEVLPEGHRFLRFNKRGSNFVESLHKIGRTPLPPYIKNRAVDPERYQTVYSKIPGSAAAPTAGLHFSDDYLRRLMDSQINAAYLTLHVGPGTFAPVKTEIIEEHRMHSEYYHVGCDAAEFINRIKKIKNACQAGCDAKTITNIYPAGCDDKNIKNIHPTSDADACHYPPPKVVCVGTTSLRTLESVAGDDGFVRPCEGWTDIFIYPGYSFKCVDALLTNFHLPGSTLLMLICAFAGYDLAMEAYRRAVEAEYRFFSFGDAMLII